MKEKEETPVKKTPKKKDVDHKNETADERMNREANTEVRFLGYQYRRIPIQQQMRDLAKHLVDSIYKVENPEDTSLMNQDDCTSEVKQIFKLRGEVNQLNHAFRFRIGALFVRQEQLELDNKEMFRQTLDGIIYTDWRAFYQELFKVNRTEINNHVNWFHHVKVMPSLINSTKSWTWMKEHMAVNRLMEKIQLYYRDLTESYSNDEMCVTLQETGYIVTKVDDEGKKIVTPIKSPSSTSSSSSAASSMSSPGQ